MIVEPQFTESFNIRSREVFENQGFVLGRVAHLDRLLELARSLGTPTSMRRSGKLIDELMPEEVGTAHSNSLSSRHGKGSFPLHTDCAFWLTPPKFLILRAHNDAPNTPTRVAQGDWLRESPILVERANNAIFKVVNGRHSFLSSIAAQPFLRFDRDCMIPGSADSHSLIEEIDSSIPESHTFDVKWSTNLCLVLDNWRMLHGRANCEHTDPTRVLHRILVRGDGQC